MNDRKISTVEIESCPIFVINQEGVFSLRIEANDLEGEKVSKYLGVSNPFGISSISFFNKESDEWESFSVNSLLPNDILEDEEIKFKVVFNSAGEYPFEFILHFDEEQCEDISFNFKVNVKESVSEEGTLYSEVYEQFLSAVTDDRYAQMTEEELMIDLLPLLKRSIYYLCRIAKVPGFNLHNRDDHNYVFMQKLTEHEIECLAWGMVVSWTEQQLNSTRLIEQVYYDAGIKTYSPNDTMRNLLTLHDDYYKKLKNRLTEYNYKVVDISKFGGNE